ncbi:alpha/beta-hydrolase [Lophium mytilinum]|uniref:Carboxypeptidase n=1 Tax=Lophium mytilinum TaxID=390894 RepID=A0A6A6QYW7_9PEZI|nr:alpha/beta-hydrolase [Lophium mytilinum]
MARQLLIPALLAAFFLLLNNAGVEAKLYNTQADQKERFQKHAQPARRGIESRTTNTSSFRYLTDTTAEYRVDALPDIDIDVGELYSGFMPVDESDPDSAMFFFFEPRIGGDPVDEITIWLNGGPGCSSLEGFLQETGTFIWSWGMANAQQNMYAWANLTNMLWVEYPLGVGFSANYTPVATSEEEIAADFLKFFKNFQTKFGIKNYKIYVTGESYAGRYVPYIADAMIEAADPCYYNLSGILIYDPVIGQLDRQETAIPIVPFVEDHAKFFNFNKTYMDHLSYAYESCGYRNYTDTYLTYPASGVQPAFEPNTTADGCDLWNEVYKEAYRINPCFNVYEISLMCPLPSDPLGFPSDLVYLYPAFGEYAYFDRPDVKAAIHAPNTTWSECNGLAFNGSSGPAGYGDLSADPIQHVLPRVIETTNRVLIAGGDYDMELPVVGTLLGIQNMTWNGALGFVAQPSKPINIKLPDLQYAQVYVDSGFEGWDGPGQGIMGVQHHERGLMWAETYQSGHMQPQFQPRTSYRHLSWVLGRIEEL